MLEVLEKFPPKQSAYEVPYKFELTKFLWSVRSAYEVLEVLANFPPKQSAYEVPHKLELTKFLWSARSAYKVPYPSEVLTKCKRKGA